MPLVALVTGSTSGIGLGVASSLAAIGYNVIITGFGDDEFIQSLLSQFTGGKVDYVAADLSKPEQIDEMYKQIKVLYPAGIDVLVNNAGFQFVSPVEEFPLDTWNTMMAVMVTAPFHLIKLFLPDMRKKGWGRIINVASVHGHVASPNKSAYVTAKHGIIGLTKVVALETAGTGITCNAICPGWVATELFWKQVDKLAAEKKITKEEAKMEIVSAKHPSKECVSIAQISETVKYMCSSAANQMTGSSLILDGGWLAI